MFRGLERRISKWRTRREIKRTLRVLACTHARPYNYDEACKRAHTLALYRACQEPPQKNQLEIG